MKHFSQNSLVDNNIKVNMFVIFKTSIKDFAFNNLPLFDDNKHVKISFDFPLIKYDFWQFLRNKFIIKTPPQFKHPISLFKN
jgi:hypothetical protein